MKRRGKNGFRLTQFLLACGMLAFVTVFVTVAMRGDLERRRVASWPEVACEIVGSEVKQKSLDDYRFTASFKYEANGRTKSPRKSYGCPDSLVEVASLEHPAPMGSVEFRFPAVLKAKAMTSEIRVTQVRMDMKKMVDIFAIP